MNYNSNGTNSIVIDVMKSAFIMCVGFCSAYLTEVTKFSPYYVAVIFVLINIVTYVVRAKKFYIDSSLTQLFIMFAFMTIWGVINTRINPTQYNKFSSYFILLIVNQFSTILIYYIGMNSQIDRDDVIKAFRIYFWISTVIAIFDLGYRYLHRMSAYTGIHWYRNLKGDSIIFADSNYVGFIYMVAFCIFLYLYREWKINLKKELVIYSIIVFFSASRAAIVCCLLMFVLSFLLGKLYRFGKAIIVFIPLLAIIAFYGSLLFGRINSRDISFNTKLWIIKGFNYYLNNSSLKRLLIGNGLQAATTDTSLYGNNIWYYGHLYVVIKIIDIGIIGFVLEIAYFLIILVKTHYRFIYLLLPFVLSGLSFCPSNLSYFYVFAGVMLLLEKNREGIEI